MPAFFVLFVDNVGIFAELLHAIFHAMLDGAAMAQYEPARPRRVDEFVKSTWDAAPRTEHAVLAAGEALEVAAAAHFCCVSWLFCLLIAPLRATSGQPPKLCAVFTACGAIAAMRSL